MKAVPGKSEEASRTNGSAPYSTSSCTISWVCKLRGFASLTHSSLKYWKVVYGTTHDSRSPQALASQEAAVQIRNLGLVVESFKV